MSKTVVVTSLALLAAAALLPAGATAEWLAAGNAERVDALRSGVQTLRVALAALGALLLALERFAPRTGTFEPLVASGLHEPRRP